MQERIPPQNIEAEQAVLGAISYRPEIFTGRRIRLFMTP